MFNTLVYLDNNNNILDVSKHSVNGFISKNKKNVLIISCEMLYSIDINKFESDLIIIIGTQAYHGIAQSEIKCFESLQSSIKFLSNNCAQYKWWIVCCMNMLNDLIWNGAIDNIYITKFGESSDATADKFDFSLLDEPSCQFKLIDDDKNGINVMHYFRFNHEEQKYLNAMDQIIKNGSFRDNRTGVSTYSVFGKTFEYKMIERVDPSSKKSLYQFPMLTTKKMFLRGVFAELKWFLSGQTDSKILESQGVNIWKDNSSRKYLDSYGLTNYEEGKCGPIYGHQWRSWNAKYDQSKDNHIGEGRDQVLQCINSLKMDPFSRRHIISGWNVEQIDEMALPPCHVIYQFYVHEENEQKYLSLSMYQRSGDTFLGVPFNICSMGLLLLMVANQVGYKPYKLIHTIGDMHIYENHVDAVSKQLTRTPNMFPFIGLSCEAKEHIEDYSFNDIIVDGYVSHSAIKAPMVA